MSCMHIDNVTCPHCANLDWLKPAPVYIHDEKVSALQVERDSLAARVKELEEALRHNKEAQDIYTTLGKEIKALQSKLALAEKVVEVVEAARVACYVLGRLPATKSPKSLQTSSFVELHKALYEFYKLDPSYSLKLKLHTNSKRK